MRKLILATLLSGLFSVQNAQAYNLELSPANQSTTVGNALVYDVWVKGLGSEPLTAYEFTLNYNPSILYANFVFNLTTKLNQGSSGNSVFDIQGSVGAWGLSEFSYLSDAELAGQGSDFRLMSISFNALAQGTTDITLTPGVFSGHSELDSFGDLMPVSLVADSVTNAMATVRADGQQNVPEPSALALLGIGLFGLTVARRRKK